MQPTKLILLAIILGSLAFLASCGDEPKEVSSTQKSQDPPSLKKTSQDKTNSDTKKQAQQDAKNSAGETKKKENTKNPSNNKNDKNNENNENNKSTKKNNNKFNHLPPDPGKEGKLTIEGIDSDDDGVRDDIQRYIAFSHPNSQKVRQVLSLMAKANQEFILNADDKEKVLIATKKQGKHISCFFYVDPEGAYNKLRSLKAEMLNTEERTLAYIKADSLLGGMIFRLADDEKSQWDCCKLIFCCL